MRFLLYAEVLVFFIFALFAGAFFLLGYASDKEHIKSKMCHVISDHAIVMCAGVIMFSLCLMIFTSLLGYSTLTTGNIHINTRTSGIVFEILISVLVFFSGLLMFREGRNASKKRVYVENASAEYAQMEQYDAILGRNESEDDMNMKLPV